MRISGIIKHTREVQGVDSQENLLRYITYIQSLAYPKVIQQFPRITQPERREEEYII